MKRFLCCFLILLMLIPPVVVAAEGEPSISMVGAQGRLGERVTVVLSCQNMPDSAGMEMILDYDHQALKPLCVRWSSSLKGQKADNVNYSIQKDDGIGEIGQKRVKMAGFSANNNPFLTGSVENMLEVDFQIIAVPEKEEGAKVEIVKQYFSPSNANQSEIEPALASAYVTFNPIAVQSVEMISAPTKTAFMQNYDALDLAGCKVEITYAGESAVATRAIGTNSVILEQKDEEDDTLSAFISGYDNAVVGDRDLTFALGEKSLEIPITIFEKPQSISIKTLPKTQYIENQSLAVSGGVLLLTYEDGRTEEKSMSDSYVSVTGYKKANLGDQVLTVAYGDITTTYTVNVRAKQLASISVYTQPKNEYKEGEELDLSKGKITLRYDNSQTTRLAMTEEGVVVRGYDKNKAGEQELTVEYQGKTTTFKVTVIGKVLQTMEIKTQPKLDYIEGEALDLSGGVLLLTYDNGQTVELPMIAEGVSVTAYDKNQVGDQKLTITYEEKSVEITVHVSMLPPVIALETNEGKAGQTGIQFQATLQETGIRAGTLTVQLPEWAKNIRLTAGCENVIIQGQEVRIVGSVAEGTVLFTGSYDIDALGGENGAITVEAADIENVAGEKTAIASVSAPATIDVVRGDACVDGAINLKDALDVLRNLVGRQPKINRANADADGDGAVSINDATRIIRWWLGDHSGPQLG